MRLLGTIRTRTDNPAFAAGRAFQMPLWNAIEVRTRRLVGKYHTSEGSALGDRTKNRNMPKLWKAP
jgi:hypothetical protein